MRKGRILTAAVSLLLLAALALNLTGCFTTVNAENLMDGIAPQSVERIWDLTEGSAAVTDFAVRLFKASASDGNTLISPLSVLTALAMTANGADTSTLSEMESVLGMSVEELNLFLYSYVSSLPEGEDYKLRLANSIWFTESERFNVNTDFLQTNADYYGADVYKSPFDKGTVRDINNWVKLNTDGLIPSILDSIPSGALMYLINALVFDAEWRSVYERSDVRDGVFTTESGDVRDVELMHSTEGHYLEDGLARGFVKYYKGAKYAFVAMLPNEGVSISDYIGSLDGESLSGVLDSPEQATVKAAIPKFKTEYSVELASILSAMGMSSAFDPDSADFSRIGDSSEGNIYITSVLHKTYIAVDERGTKAGAVTSIGVGNSMAPPMEIKEIYLDRPFVYMLIDCENNIPFFIGTLTDVAP